MDVIYRRCCGLDVHKDSVSACVLVAEPMGRRHKELTRFGTMTGDLLQLLDWLLAMRVTHLAVVRAGSLVAETGARMEQFPSAQHMASWAGLCPGNNESAGKRKSGKIRKGSLWLRRTLSQASWAASLTKARYLAARYRPLAARRGAKRAIIAVAHNILLIAYYLLTTDRPYEDLGADCFDRINAEGLKRCPVKRLERMGHQVVLAQAAAA